MDSTFRMGSMGSVVGEKITLAIEKADELSVPFIIFTASGGARMQEGVLSLMQMAKTSVALKRFSDNGGLIISIMTHPTTGGVSASFASLGDYNLAEPGALIGFAGRRIIEQTIREELPEDFQTSEFLMKHGQLDAVISRIELKEKIATILSIHQQGGDIGWQGRDAFAQECLLAIKNGVKLQDDDWERLKSDEYYLKDSQEMVELLAEYPDALENTIKIAEQCNVMLELHQQKLPKYPVEKDQTADQLLEEVCWEGFKERYPLATEEHYERLKYELKIIKKMRFSDYFLIVWDFMRFSKKNGILTGPGRGSAAGSMVAFVLHITDVDPEYK